VAYRTAGALRKAFALSGERWLTVCGMCRDPAFRMEFHALRAGFRVKRPHRNRPENQVLWRALTTAMPALVARVAWQKAKRRKDDNP
jgi:hypothetical protein